MSHKQGTHGTGKTRKMGGKNPCQGKHREFGNFAKTQNFVCSSCTFPDSKGIGYCDICRGNFHFFPKAGYVCQVIFVYVIVTNYVNWHRENLRSDREKPGQTQGN